MTNNIILRYSKVIFCLSILCIILSLVGCLSSPGETSSEVHRRHMRVIRNDALQIQDDVDAVLLLDKPSRLSDKVQR